MAKVEPRETVRKVPDVPTASPVSPQEGAFRSILVSVHLHIHARSCAHTHFRTVSEGAFPEVRIPDPAYRSARATEVRRFHLRLLITVPCALLRGWIDLRFLGWSGVGARRGAWSPRAPVWASSGLGSRTPPHKPPPFAETVHSALLTHCNQYASSFRRGALHGRPRRVGRRVARESADLRGGRHVSRTAASSAVDLTKSYAQEHPPSDMIRSATPEPAIRADAASLLAAREASLVESR
jgi:hypothetical protein